VGAEVPQLLTALTVRLLVPVMAPTVAVIKVVVDVPLQPEGSVQI
jgi:hypothetical protein